MDFWMGGTSDMAVPGGTSEPDIQRMRISNDSNVRCLQDQVDRLAILNQALWELIQERINLTDADLEARVREVDLRDGKPDGKISEVAVRCPTCQRVCNSRHAKCLYCGTLFQKPLFG